MLVKRIQHILVVLPFFLCVCGAYNEGRHCHSFALFNRNCPAADPGLDLWPWLKIPRNILLNAEGPRVLCMPWLFRATPIQAGKELSTPCGGRRRCTPASITQKLATLEEGMPILPWRKRAHPSPHSASARCVLTTFQ